MKSVTIFYSKNNNPDPKDFFHIPAGSNKQDYSLAFQLFFWMQFPMESNHYEMKPRSQSLSFS